MKLKKEILYLGISFIAAELVNLYAIILYSRPLTELFSMIGYVFAITVVFYLLILIVRLAVTGIKKLVEHKR